MIPALNIATEYSFRSVYGPVGRIVERLAQEGVTAACVSDLHNTYAHVPWADACKKAGIKPVFASTFSVVPDIHVNEKIAGPGYVSCVALNNKGLRELYQWVRFSYTKFYYHPRIDYDTLRAMDTDNVALIGWGGLRREADVDHWLGTTIAGQENRYILPTDVMTYELLTEERVARKPFHILTSDEWLAHNNFNDAALAATEELLERADATLARAPMVAYPDKQPGQLERLCRAGAEALGCDLTRPEYAERLQRELDLIEEKNYVDYFLVVADLVAFAKRHMLVGPARGSSAGSLVCYLTGITTIDPIPFGLLFERFIDVNRSDLPDIDIDFPDTGRERVIQYLRDKYGSNNVAHIGTVNTLGARSAIGLFAKGLGIPAYETAEVKDGIIERSSGDARAAFCIEDTFTTTDAGKRFIEKHPRMALVGEVEGHARHSGVHAAGIVVCPEPLTNFGGVDARQDVLMMDKNQAEALNLLKIDVLGLRTLSILQQCIEDIGMTPQELYALPLDDQPTFDMMTEMRLAGVFQFEGYALQSLCRQMGIGKFNDIVAITALSRPGPLHSGGATLYIGRRTGRDPVEYFHPDKSVVDYTEEEYGTIIYQEQVMQIGRNFGGLSWEDVSALRKAMSKSLGEEFFAGYKKKFVEGALDKATEEEANYVWENMETFGSMGFNKSHAVSYGLLSYWCAYLKCHHPLQFARASLNNAKDAESAVALLREFGIPHRAVDPDRSGIEWTIHNGELVGPLSAIKGIGPKIAADIVERRSRGDELTQRQTNLLTSGVTPYDELYPCRALWGEYYEGGDPLGILNGPVNFSYLKDVQGDGKYTFIGQLVDRNLRDLNEYGNVVKRGGKKVQGPSLFLNLTLKDDTDSIICTIQRYNFEQLGREIAERGKVGEDWYAIHGEMVNGWRKIYVKRIIKLNAEHKTQSEDHAQAV